MTILCPRNAAQSTQIVATFRDTGFNLITQGQVNFDLQPAIDTTIAGYARFTPSTAVCGINAMANAGITSMTRAAGTVTVVFTTTNPFITNDQIEVSGAVDTTYDGVFSPVTVSGLSMTYAQAGGNTNTSGESIANLRPTPGTGPCQLVQNTAINPPGTSYKATIQPNFSTTSLFNFFAVGAGPLDLTTVVPTPATLPAYLVGLLGGANTWTQPNIFSQLVTFNGGIVINGPCTGIGCSPIANITRNGGTAGSGAPPGLLLYTVPAAQSGLYLLSYHLETDTTGAAGNAALYVQSTCDGFLNLMQLTGPLTDLLRTDATGSPLIGAVAVCADQSTSVYIQVNVTGGFGTAWILRARLIRQY